MTGDTPQQTNAQQPQPQPQQAQTQQPQQQRAQTPAAAPQRNGPADTLYDGRVKATMWERSGETGPAYATKISRTYTDKDGQPRDTAYLSGADLLRASRVAEKAYEREQELTRERNQARTQDNTQDEAERENRKEAHRSARERGTRRPRSRSHDR